MALTAKEYEAIGRVFLALGTSCAGRCYHASRVLYEMFGGKKAGWTPMRGETALGSHWWLQKKDGTRVDVTAWQFDETNLKYLYSVGKGCGFRVPSPDRPVEYADGEALRAAVTRT